jgi:hypothetical protein
MIPLRAFALHALPKAAYHVRQAGTHELLALAGEVIE